MKSLIRKLLHEDLTYHHVTDATKDKYRLDENVGDVGFHAGNLKYKAERLSDRNFIIGRTGNMGTGHYFYGDIKDALKHASSNINKIGSDSIYSVDFSRYNLFKPKSPTEFYDGLVNPLTHFLGQLNVSDLNNKDVIDTLKDAADFYRHSGVNISDEELIFIAKKFVSELASKSPKDNELFNTKVLKQAGYEGVDVRNTALDNFGVGSVIFDLKKGTVNQVN